VVRWWIINANSGSHPAWLGGWALGGAIAGLVGMGVTVAAVTRRQ